MLAKKYHLPSSFFSSFTKKRKNSFSEDVFYVLIFPSENNFSRFAVVASVKNFKKASERNKLRRTVFDFLREKKKFEIGKKDFVFNLNPEIISLGKNDIYKELERFFNKIN